MLNKYLLLFVSIGIIGMIGLVGSYTPPTFDSVNFSLCSGYTVPSLESINFTIGEDDSCITDSCTYTSGDWEVDCSDNCSIESNVDLGGNDLIFDNAGFFFVKANIINFGNLNFGDPSEVCQMVFDDNTFLIN